MKSNNIKIKATTGILSAILSAALLILCFSSCTDELSYPYEGEYDGEEISVPFSLSVLPLQSENPESRAIEYIEASPDEKEIHDFWLIEYHENGTRIGLPRYYAKNSEGEGLPEKLNIIVPRRDTDKYTCVLIANSNDPDLFNADNRSKFSTLDDLRTFELSTHNHEHVFDPKQKKIPADERLDHYNY